VAAVVAVAVVTTAAVCTAASASAGATAFAAEKEKKVELKEDYDPEVIMAVVENTPKVQETIEEHVSLAKELIVEENLLQVPKLPHKKERSLEDKARDLGSYVAHDIFDAVVDLAIVVPDSLRDTGHAKIDQIFSTKFAIRWSREVRENSVMDNVAMGIIPVPGQLNSGIFSAGKPAVGSISKTEANAIKGWVVGHEINNLTQFGTVPTWSTVRRRYWKNRAHFHPHKYEPVDLERMKKGLAPQRVNSAGELESMELHHIPPQREGNLFDVIEVWPEEHALLDSCRQIRR
jgi:hypothetical protein